MIVCPECNGRDCARIEIHLKEDHTVEFFSCRTCEAKWWEEEGTTIALDDVLDLASNTQHMPAR